jgi:hypothetical protein
MKTENINIQHIDNGGEFKIPGTKYRADGYCKETNTIYEHQGCQWHGCKLRFQEQDISPFRKVTYKHLFDETVKREINSRLLGYNLVVMWEHTWDRLSKLINTEEEHLLKLYNDYSNDNVSLII